MDLFLARELSSYPFFLRSMPASSGHHAAFPMLEYLRVLRKLENQLRRLRRKWSKRVSPPDGVQEGVATPKATNKTPENPKEKNPQSYGKAAKGRPSKQKEEEKGPKVEATRTPRLREAKRFVSSPKGPNSPAEKKKEIPKKEQEKKEGLKKKKRGAKKKRLPQRNQRKKPRKKRKRFQKPKKKKKRV